jgi:hypothetical protein
MSKDLVDFFLGFWMMTPPDALPLLPRGRARRLLATTMVQSEASLLSKMPIAVTVKKQKTNKKI